MKCLFGAGLVRTEREVGDDERARDSSGYGPGERDQLIDGHRQGGVETEHVVTRRITDQQEVDACLVEDLCAQLVVAGETGDLDPVLLRRLEVTGAYPLEAGLRGCLGWINHGVTLFRSGSITRARAVGDGQSSVAAERHSGDLRA